MDIKLKTGIDFDHLSKMELAVMMIMMHIFAVVVGIEHIIAKLTGLTYNEVNIIMYYNLIPFSWMGEAKYRGEYITF